MGVLVADTKNFINGLALSNFVISIRGVFTFQKMRTCDENQTTYYQIDYSCYYYASEAAYEAGARDIWYDVKTLKITEAQITGDLFALIYEDIESNYQNTSQI